ncbi:MAG TPA: adenylosuccinate synthetase [Allosphingosinicella sp.]|jgi:adenylosuccinate synthase
MPATIVVGGQFGSEGKGKIAAWLAPNFRHAVRTGGPNAGHTVVEGGRSMVLRHLPCAVINRDAALYLGAGSILDPDILLREIAENQILPGRLRIDPTAVVITRSHLDDEVELVNRIGSTGKGVGGAVASKVLRAPEAVLARDVPELSRYIGEVADSLHRALREGENILLEGTQGAGLSLHHGSYPFVTSRETTAGSLCGEAGIGPLDVERVVLVVRTYPIRVAGTSGPLPAEISWDDVTARSGYAMPIREYTTVTGRLRRVGEFDIHAVARAARLNSATEIALTFVDYLDCNVRDATEGQALTQPVTRFIDELEAATNTPVTIVSTGPETSATVIRQARHGAREA